MVPSLAEVLVALVLFSSQPEAVAAASPAESPAPSETAAAVAAPTLVAPVVPEARAADAHPHLAVLCETLASVWPRLGGEGSPRPSYLAYALFDARSSSLVAEGGALTEDRHEHDVHAMVRLRVGDRMLDNTHHVANDPGTGLRRRRSMRWVALPPAASPDLVRRLVEETTDSVYGRAAADLAAVRAADTLAATPSDRSPDLSEETPEVSIVRAPKFSFDAAAWADRARRASAVFNRHPGLLGGSVSVRAGDETRLLVTSEGTVVQQPAQSVFLAVRAWARAADGEDLALQWDGYAPDGAAGPDTATLEARADDLARRVLALVEAAPAEPYVGPLLLSGRAAGVMFHEVLGHPIEGQRQRADEQAQTFRDKLGQAVLPDFLSVVFDPTLRELGGNMLAGAYEVDDEGVRARRLVAIEGGILRAFLMSRLPITGFPRSNGHGRAQPSYLPVARQSVLVVQASRVQPVAELRTRLRELARARGLEYGLAVAGVERGASRSARGEPNAFNVVPLEVSRVWVDGRPDTLVRGVELVGTPLAALGKLVAAGDDIGVFNGRCGAESGWIPVSAASPSLLFEEVEIQRARKTTQPPPLLPAPRLEESGGKGGRS